MASCAVFGRRHEDHAEDAFAPLQRLAQVALEQPGEVGQVLRRERAVEVEPLSDVRDVCSARGRTADQDCRVARRQVQDEKSQERDPEQDRHRF